MIKTMKRILSFTAALAIAASMSTSVYAVENTVDYSDGEWVKSSLTRSSYNGATALTESSNNVICGVSLQITCYNLENVTDTYTTGTGNSYLFYTSVSLRPNDGYFCLSASSTHTCSYYGFSDSLKA